MRKIEQQMIAAIRQGKNWQGGNTTVSAPTLGEWSVHLHGNMITVGSDKGLRFTLAGWPTPTTRSRVNALLREFIHANACVYQSDGRQWFTGPDTWNVLPDGRRAISSTEWVQA